MKKTATATTATKIDSEFDYQKRELNRWSGEMNDTTRQWFDNTEDFSKRLECSGYFAEQMQWICDGSYGAGACLRIQQINKSMETFRGNKEAVLGVFFLSAMYGHQFGAWRKLTPKAQAMVSKAVRAWMKKRDKGFGLRLLV